MSGLSCGAWQNHTHWDDYRAHPDVNQAKEKARAKRALFRQVPGIGQRGEGGLLHRRRSINVAATRADLHAAEIVKRDAENERLREALRYRCGATINSLVADGIPPEWSEGSGIAIQLRALGCDSLRLDDAARAALSTDDASAGERDTLQLPPELEDVVARAVEDVKAMPTAMREQMARARRIDDASEGDVRRRALEEAKSAVWQAIQKLRESTGDELHAEDYVVVASNAIARLGATPPQPAPTVQESRRMCLPSVNGNSWSKAGRSPSIQAR